MVRFLFLLSITFSPIGWEECFSQSWQVPHRLIGFVLSSRETLFEEWGMWHFVQFPSWTGLCFTSGLFQPLDGVLVAFPAEGKLRLLQEGVLPGGVRAMAVLAATVLSTTGQ